MMKLNILHIVYAKEWGGGETAALSMIKKQLQFGHRVIVLLDKKSSLFEKYFSIAKTILTIDFSNFINSVLILHNTLKKYNINIIHTHTGKVIPFVILAKIQTKAKLIAFRHNVLKNKKDIIHRLIYRNIDAFVCVSKKVYEYQVNSIDNTLRNRFYVVYNGIKESGCIGVNRYNDYARELVCGFAGRIDESKGIQYLLETMTLLRKYNIRLKIAGDNNNEYGKVLKKFTIDNKLEDKVEWLGFQDIMETFYPNIDVLIAPSIIPEAFGLVLCEAMYCNCAVISSNSGAQHEIIDNGINGVLLNSINSNEILDAILSYYNDRDLLYRHQVEAKKKVEKLFTMDCWMSSMNKIYDVILSRNI